MHTDEYEISIGREIAICRKMVRQFRNSLDRRAEQTGLTTPEFLKALERGSLAEKPPIQAWKQEYRALQYWEKMLAQYEAGLASLK